MSAEQLAKLCLLLEELSKQGVEVEDVYQAAFDKGVKACDGKSVVFYKLCENTRESGV